MAQRINKKESKNANNLGITTSERASNNDFSDSNGFPMAQDPKMKDD